MKVGNDLCVYKKVGSDCFEVLLSFVFFFKQRSEIVTRLEIGQISTLRFPITIRTLIHNLNPLSYISPYLIIGSHQATPAGVEGLLTSSIHCSRSSLMRREGMVLGGEQSGHVIFLDDMPTGDGQLTALHFLKIVCETRQPVSRLAAEVTQYPQVLINVPAPHDLQARKALLHDAAGHGHVLILKCLKIALDLR